MMHAVLIPNTNKVLYWGYHIKPSMMPPPAPETVPNHDQSILWDHITEKYSLPANQPSDVFADQNIWSCSHAFLSDGNILIYSGNANPAFGATTTENTECLSFIFNATTLRWSGTGMTNKHRFY